MIDPLHSKLVRVAARYQQLQLWRSLTLCWLVASVVGLIVLIVHWVSSYNIGFLIPVLIFCAVVGAFFALRHVRKTALTVQKTAREIEDQNPELQALLLTAIEQEPDARTGELSYLQKRVIREALATSETCAWLESVPAGKMVLAETGHWCAVVLLVAMLCGMWISIPKKSNLASATQPGQLSSGIFVNPGDTNVERGSSIVIDARFAENALPSDATLVTTDAKGSKRVPLTRTLNDPIFGIHLPEVDAAFSYRIESAGKKTREFKVAIYEHPELKRADAHLQFPGSGEKVIPDTLLASGVEGTLVDFKIQFNKPAVTARLVAEDQSVVPLVLNADGSGAALTAFELVESKRYLLELVDSDGRRNKKTAEFIFDVLTLQPPALSMISPAGDERVSPLEEVTFKASAISDSGIKTMGLTYAIGGAAPKTITANQHSTSSPKLELSHLLLMENLDAKADQLLTYYVWADDMGADGKIRRTSSDLFYAEVRPFEETFRQGQCHSTNFCVKLIEQQKMIIDATWALRDEKENRLSKEYKEKLPIVLQSQENAIKEASALKAAAMDLAELQNWTEVLKEMKKAAASLKESAQSPRPLPNALSAEQAAYQALLRLEPRQNKLCENPNGKPKLVERKKRQTDQLEKLALKPSTNLVEAAKPNEAPLDERIKLMFRLKELAQHQTDINAILKELQTDVRGDKEAQERELKRLGEEQRQMLSEIDQARQQMEKMPDRSKLADAKQKLEQSRSQCQSAGQSIAAGSVSQALASGTRAQQGLEKLRGDFHKSSANAFAQSMQNLRDQAGALAREQEKIASELASLPSTRQNPAQAQAKQKAVADQLAEQQKQVANLLKEMRAVTEQAEKAEPLLSKKLYEALRNQSRGDLDKTLNLSEQMVRQNFADEARPYVAEAGKNLNALKDTIDKAAESILGDETEALHFAKRELDELTQQLKTASKPASGNPITGTNYLEWSTRLSNLEEVLGSPELQSGIATVRSHAHAMRSEFKRHSQLPEWKLVESEIAAPLAEVRQAVVEQLARIESKDALVPIDRDPVPGKYSKLVQHYYENLGTGETAGSGKAKAKE